jgi:hypothetical protein
MFVSILTAKNFLTKVFPSFLPPDRAAVSLAGNQKYNTLLDWSNITSRRELALPQRNYSRRAASATRNFGIMP